MGRRRKAGYNGGLTSRPWVPERDDKRASELYAKGFSLSEICKKMNSGYTTVRNHLVELGVYKPSVREKERESKMGSVAESLLVCDPQYLFEGALKLRPGKRYVLDPKPAGEMHQARNHLPETCLGKFSFVGESAGVGVRHFIFRKFSWLVSFSDRQLRDLRIREA